MNNPYASQQRTQLENAPPQSAEGWALVETARRLETAKNNPSDVEEIVAVIRLNWRIWTIIQASLVDPECPLPLEIRENLLNLSRFIDRRSAELIAKPTDIHKIDVLINIDRQIGAGLLGNPPEGTSRPAPAPGQAPANTPQSVTAPPSSAASAAASLLSAQENDNGTTARSSAGSDPAAPATRSGSNITSTEA